MYSLKWLLYYLEKPFHSCRHKKIKRLATEYAKANNSQESALQEIVEYTGESPAVIKEKYEKLRNEINCRKYDGLTESQIDSFYAQTEHYLYELPLWNAGSGRIWAILLYLLPYFKSKGYREILDFGAGTGDLSLALAKVGFSVSYLDLNQVARKFTEWRAGNRGVNIHFLADSDMKGKVFDSIVSFDVFEHLKNLPEKVNYLASLLRFRGALIFNFEFSGEGLHIQENKKYQNVKLLDSMLSNNGLSFDKKFKNFFFYKKNK